MTDHKTGEQKQQDPDVDAHLVLRLAGAAEAEAAMAALAPENGDHLQVEVQGAELRITVPAGRLASVAETVDDALACLGGALGSVDAADDDQ